MRRSTIVVVILFLVVAAIFWYMQQPGNVIISVISTSTPTPSGSIDTLIPLAKSPINGLTIQDAAGKTLKLARTNGQWTINIGQDQPADQSGAETAAGYALNLTILKKFDTPPDVAGTGLDKPVYTISVTLGDNSITTFVVGKPTVTGSGYYVQVQGDKVYILTKSELDNLTQVLTAPPLYKTATPAVTEPSGALPVTPAANGTPGATSTVMPANGTPNPTNTSGPIINLTVAPTSTP